MTLKYEVTLTNYKTHEDSGQWRSYDLVAEGDTLEELLDSCTVFEMDQDGGDITSYTHCDTPEYNAILNWFNKETKNVL